MTAEISRLPDVERILDLRIATVKEFFILLEAEREKRYEQRFKDSQTAVDAALNAAKEAVLKAEGASERRFEGVNEFRNTLADQQRTLMPRAEAELRMGSIETRVSELSKAITARGAAAQGGREVWAWVFAAIMAAAALVSYFRK
jgi:phosphopantetheinyl transferase (holo-ACP synthase)